MNPYNAAHTLAKALKESAEFRAFKEAQDTLKQDQSAHEMLADFRKEQIRIQQQQLSGVEVAPEQQEKLIKMQEIISMNLTVKRYMEAEYRVAVLMRDIQKIIGDATADLFDPDLFSLPEIEDHD